jgi:hypothetical protein
MPEGIGRFSAEGFALCAYTVPLSSASEKQPSVLRTKQNEPFARHGREIRKSDPDGLPLGCRPVVARRESKRAAASCAGLGKGKKNEERLAILDP